MCDNAIVMHLLTHEVGGFGKGENLRELLRRKVIPRHVPADKPPERLIAPVGRWTKHASVDAFHYGG